MLQQWCAFARLRADNARAPPLAPVRTVSPIH
jgi:hypothetical protein